MYVATEVLIQPKKEAPRNLVDGDTLIRKGRTAANYLPCKRPFIVQEGAKGRNTRVSREKGGKKLSDKRRERGKRQKKHI